MCLKKMLQCCFLPTTDYLNTTNFQWTSSCLLQTSDLRQLCLYFKTSRQAGTLATTNIKLLKMNFFILSLLALSIVVLGITEQAYGCNGNAEKYLRLPNYAE